MLRNLVMNPVRRAARWVLRKELEQLVHRDVLEMARREAAERAQVLVKERDQARADFDRLADERKRVIAALPFPGYWVDSVLATVAVAGEWRKALHAKPGEMPAQAVRRLKRGYEANHKGLVAKLRDAQTELSRLRPGPIMRATELVHSGAQAAIDLLRTASKADDAVLLYGLITRAVEMLEGKT